MLHSLRRFCALCRECVQHVLHRETGLSLISNLPRPSSQRRPKMFLSKSPFQAKHPMAKLGGRPGQRHTPQAVAKFRMISRRYSRESKSKTSDFALAFALGHSKSTKQRCEAASLPSIEAYRCLMCRHPCPCPMFDAWEATSSGRSGQRRAQQTFMTSWG